MKVASLFLATSMLCAPTLSRAQDMTFMDLMKGDRVPLMMMPNAIPQGYMAMKIKVAGGGGIMDMFGPFGMIFGMMGSAMGGAGGGAEMGPLVAMELSWTKGEMVTMSGVPFVVTYKMDMSPADMMVAGEGEDAIQKLPMKLTLVRMDSIQSISPQPDVTPAKFFEMLKKPPTPPAPKPGEEEPMEEEEEEAPPTL